MKNMIRQMLRENSEYGQELERIKTDHNNVTRSNLSTEDRHKIISRITKGLDLSARKASDFKERLDSLLDECGL